MDDIEPYALTIVTYAFAVGKSSKATEALQKLNEIAIKMGKFSRSKYSYLKNNYMFKCLAALYMEVYIILLL